MTSPPQMPGKTMPILLRTPSTTPLLLDPVSRLLIQQAPKDEAQRVTHGGICHPLKELLGFSQWRT